MEKLSPREKLKDIYLDLDINRLAKHYFNKSGSWLYHKFDRADVNKNGNKDDFTEEQLQTLKNALFDFAERIKRSAETL